MENREDKERVKSHKTHARARMLTYRVKPQGRSPPDASAAPYNLRWFVPWLLDLLSPTDPHSSGPCGRPDHDLTCITLALRCPSFTLPRAFPFQKLGQLQKPWHCTSTADNHHLQCFSLTRFLPFNECTRSTSCRPRAPLLGNRSPICQLLPGSGSFPSHWESSPILESPSTAPGEGQGWSRCWSSSSSVYKTSA